MKKYLEAFHYGNREIGTQIDRFWLDGPLRTTALEQVEFFEKKIRPLLAEHCYECHAVGQKLKGGLALDSREGWMKGGAFSFFWASIGRMTTRWTGPLVAAASIWASV